jgi:hypothetical protein
MPAIPDTAGWGCTSQRLCNAFKDMWVYRTKWALPKDFKCSHCKLQWVRLAAGGAAPRGGAAGAGSGAIVVKRAPAGQEGKAVWKHTSAFLREPGRAGI